MAEQARSERAMAEQARAAAGGAAAASKASRRLATVDVPKEPIDLVNTAVAAPASAAGRPRSRSRSPPPSRTARQLFASPADEVLYLLKNTPCRPSMTDSAAMPVERLWSCILKLTSPQRQRSIDAMGPTMRLRLRAYLHEQQAQVFQPPRTLTLPFRQQRLQPQRGQALR
mmetsp:Transcript_43449/g.131389  ORF Transcript_43449/g.131389 Transcript_43449/m.131389 type:complete len:171 (-) Transcript_43449:371-883(-)